MSNQKDGKMPICYDALFKERLGLYSLVESKIDEFFYMYGREPRPFEKDMIYLTHYRLPREEYMINIGFWEDFIKKGLKLYTHEFKFLGVEKAEVTNKYRINFEKSRNNLKNLFYFYYGSELSRMCEGENFGIGDILGGNDFFNIHHWFHLGVKSTFNKGSNSNLVLLPKIYHEFMDSYNTRNLALAEEGYSDSFKFVASDRKGLAVYLGPYKKIYHDKRLFYKASNRMRLPEVLLTNIRLNEMGKGL